MNKADVNAIILKLDNFQKVMSSQLNIGFFIPISHDTTQKSITNQWVIMLFKDQLTVHSLLYFKKLFP